MLTGFLRPSSGSVNILNYKIEENPLEIKKILGYLPESAPLYHDMLVYDYLNYVADIRAVEKSRKLDRIHQLANLCGINEVMHKPVNELSKGYKQRVGLAHAMMNDPEILILDEPTSGLDPNQIVEIRQIIKQIGKEKTIILSTHILSEAEATCDRVVIINRGKIVADGSTESLKESAGDKKHIHLTLQNADFKTVDKILSSLEAINGVTRIAESDSQLEVRLDCRTDSDQRAAIYHQIKQTDWIMLDFHQETQTLETIFRELTLEDA
jgi:ABC-2 type transport system ATP-binding protein